MKRFLIGAALALAIASIAITQTPMPSAFQGGSSAGGSSAFSALTSATNTIAAMLVGTGASLGVTGSGTIAATSAPVAGITGLGAGVGTALAAAPSGSGGICLASGSACSGGSPATGFQTYGYDSSNMTAIGDATTCAGIIFPSALSVGHILFFVQTADAVNDSDVGFYSLTGTLLAHVGAQTIGTTNAVTLAFVGGTVPLPGAPVYFCMTSAASTLSIYALTNIQTFFSFGTVSAATTGGALNSSITPPSNNPLYTSVLPSFVLLP